MREIRLLNYTDLSDIESLLSLDADSRLAFVNYFLDSSEVDYRSYGSFVNDELTAIVSVIGNKEIPAYTISRIHSVCVVGKFLTDVIDIEESALKQFFTLTDSEEFFQMVELFHKYQPYIEHIVKKNQLTGYENIDHDVLSYRRQPADMTVYLWVLKNEYRTV